MKKNHTRDYATEAFRFYKAVGGVEAYKDKIWNEALKRREVSEIKGTGISNPTEADIMRAERAVETAFAEVADLEAVERTLYIISRSIYGREIRQAIEIVYFTDAGKELKRGDIQARVHKAGLHIPASEKTVYRYLAKARETFSTERGLRL